MRVFQTALWKILGHSACKNSNPGRNRQKEIYTVFRAIFQGKRNHMGKSRQFWGPLLAGSISLSLFACQLAQSPTGSKPLTQSPNLLDSKTTQPSQPGFRTQDWVTDTGRYRGADGLTHLNIQVDFQNSTARSPNNVSIDMGTPAVPGRPEYEPTYNIFFSDYILDANGHQVPTRGFLIYSDYMLPSVTGINTNFASSMNFFAYMESSDGIHFRFIEGSQGRFYYQYGAPDAVEHGNIGVCTFGETGDLTFDFDYGHSTLTLNSDNKTFTTNLIMANGIGTKSHGMSPWQCTYQCSPQNGGAYNEQCGETAKMAGTISMEGHLNFTEPTQMILKPIPDIFSTNPDAHGGNTDFYVGNLPPDQIWRLTLPNYNGAPLTVQQNGSVGDGYILGWYGEKSGSPWNPKFQFNNTQTFYQDGTYPVDLVSDHGQHLSTSVRIDSTAPKISDPVLKILPDGRRQILITVKDPEVKGVRAGLDAGKFRNGFISIADVRNANITFKQVDDNTVQAVAEYLPNPKPTPTPSSMPSSGPSGNPSSMPSSGPSGNPSSTPVPTPTATPWQDPDVGFEDESPFQIGFDAYDKVFNHTPYAMDFNPPNLKLLVDYPHFSPDNDGIIDTISYHVVNDTPAENWSLQIKNNGGNIVKTISGYGSEDLIWDGKNESGQVQPEGKYKLVLTSKKQNGLRRSQSVKNVWLDITKPISYSLDIIGMTLPFSITSLDHNPPVDGRLPLVFYPGQQNGNRLLKYKAKIGNPNWSIGKAYVNIVPYGANVNASVFKGNFLFARGLYTHDFTWDGTHYQNGLPVPKGVYQIFVFPDKDDITPKTDPNYQLSYDLVRVSYNGGMIEVSASTPGMLGPNPIEGMTCVTVQKNKPAGSGYFQNTDEAGYAVFVGLLEQNYRLTCLYNGSQNSVDIVPNEDLPRFVRVVYENGRIKFDVH